MSDPTQVTTPSPAAPSTTPSTTPSPAATTPEPSTPPSTSAASSNEPTPPAAPATPDPATPPANDPGTPPAPANPPAVEPQEYDIEVDENSPLSQEELESIASYAGKYRLSKEEAQAMVAAQENLYKRGQQTAEQQYTSRIESMRTALKSHPDFAPDKKDSTWASINRAVQVFGNEKLVESLKSPEFGYDLNIAMMLKSIGDALGPEVLPGAGTGAGGVRPPADTEDARLRRQYPNLKWD